MKVGPGRSLALSSLLLLASCKSVPTSVLLTLNAAPSVGALDQVKLGVFDDHGQVVRERRLPAEGPLALPDTVVLYPSQQAGTLRVLGLGLRAGQPVAEGIGQVSLRPSEQVALTVTLEPGRRPDRDADGVPDGIDNCPDRPNPEQTPCAPHDGGPGDGGGRDREGGPGDGASDGDSRDLAPREVSVEAAVPDQGPDQGKTCSSAADCDDKNPCTADSCANGTCTHSATNEGQSCTTSNKCFAGQTTCTVGVCSGKAKDCSSPNPCLVGSCKPTTGCTTTPKPDGTSCSDADPCTTGETCKTGSCYVPTQPLSCYIGGTCFPDGTKQGTCRICDNSKSKTSWSTVAGYCLIADTCYASGAAGGGCTICDPTKATTSWSLKPGCGILLAALNQGHSGNLGGIGGANTLCQTQAAAAGQSGTFKAFLSASTQNVKDLVPTTLTLPVVNLKGEQLYASWGQIFSTAPWTASLFLYSFDGKKVDENQGASPEWTDADCWTGSLVGGTVAPDTCSDWTSITTSGAGGELDQAGAGLGLMYPTETAVCSTTKAVVCVRIP